MGKTINYERVGKGKNYSTQKEQAMALDIETLKAENKKFEYKIYQELPGGHSFNRLDNKKAREIRLEIYQFLQPYLTPPKAFKSVRDLEKAAYQF